MTKFLTIILCVLAFTAKAQSSFTGGTFQGFEVGDTLPRQMGVFGWWDAGYGIQTTAVNKVQTLADLSGNNFVMLNYSNAALTGFNAQPIFTRAPATNFFPAIDNTLAIGTSQPRPLRIFGTFPAAYQGVNKPFTFITFCAPITNSSGPFSWVFQQPEGTNSITSIKYGFIPLTGGNTTRLTWLGDTNRATTLTAAQLASANVSISNYYYSTFTFDGVNLRAFANLTGSTNLAPALQGVFTPTLFQISGAVRTNFSGSDVNGQAYLTMFMAWTNALSGAQVTNVINWYNNNRYKAF